ncbi:hypothetical protein DFO67_102142 [Modicisalibacter xianhensis]|uniref:Lipoprotein n=1 Tax=Modicisalibacter xianhensis TaxID=442341 RepID=A0A4R8G269_9GAMM|nr:hypothetical protein [Halomonas xianhensis]TDX32193.1 hypothetical protein DFO67_102142 [Halomonas xianhensis]
MRPLLLIAAVFSLGIVVSGCSYTPARIDPEPIIEVGDGHHDHRDYDHDRGGFCPPGQAKKGRC